MSSAALLPPLVTRLRSFSGDLTAVPVARQHARDCGRAARLLDDDAIPLTYHAVPDLAPCDCITPDRILVV